MIDDRDDNLGPWFVLGLVGAPLLVALVWWVLS
jgi:hypothetical protein